MFDLFPSIRFLFFLIPCTRKCARRRLFRFFQSSPFGGNTTLLWTIMKAGARNYIPGWVKRMLNGTRGRRRFPAGEPSSSFTARFTSRLQISGQSTLLQKFFNVKKLTSTRAGLDCAPGELGVFDGGVCGKLAILRGERDVLRQAPHFGEV